MKRPRASRGVFDPAVMHRYPRRCVARTLPDWVANHVGIEKVLGAAGLLWPDFFEVDEYVFWRRGLVEALNQGGRLCTYYGSDPATVERYHNMIHIGDFFMNVMDEASDREESLFAFGQVLREFWGRALRDRFPDRHYHFETVDGLYDEDDPCVTFWRCEIDRSHRSCIGCERNAGDYPKSTVEAGIGQTMVRKDCLSSHALRGEAANTQRNVTAIRQISESAGLLDRDLLLKFSTMPYAGTFSTWVGNCVRLWEVLGIAGFLSPDFFEVGEYLFWDLDVAERIAQTDPRVLPFGDDPCAFERHFNTINLARFFLTSGGKAVEQDELIHAFGRVLRHFWGLALRDRFPERRYEFEIAHGLRGEEGLCFTFWRVRD